MVKLLQVGILTCMDYDEQLFRIRWPRGFICPRCGGTAYYPVQKRNQYECSGCGYQLSLSAGTLMHKSRIPLEKWFAAVALYNRSPDITPLEFSRTLRLTKPTGSLLLKKIRQGLVNGNDRILLTKMINEEKGSSVN
ncbi:transposase [Treponema primitia]|uniref:transposase n=1 Tax=Treponema primitia TaxID=88058 RepID=UPI0002555411|nr:transposase [Treponema primitia]